MKKNGKVLAVKRKCFLVYPTHNWVQAQKCFIMSDSLHWPVACKHNFDIPYFPTDCIEKVCIGVTDFSAFLGSDYVNLNLYLKKERIKAVSENWMAGNISQWFVRLPK